MAANVLTQIVIEALYKDKASGPAREMEKNLQDTFAKIKSGLQVFAGMTAAIYTLKKAFDIGADAAKLAGRLDDLRLAFNNLAKAQNLNADLMLTKMRAASKGLLDDISLLQLANNAMLLGMPVTADEMALLVEAGRRLGKAMGIDAKQGVESLITGIGRQSKLMLDNLGIVVSVEKANADYAASLGKTADQLTEAEQKTAFYNAVMQIVRGNLRNLGPDITTATDSFARFSVSVTNLKIAFGELFSTASTDAFNAWARNFQTTIFDIFSAAGRESFAQKIEEIRQKMWTWGSDLKALQPILRELAPNLRSAIPDQELIRRFEYFLNMSPAQFARSAIEINDLLIRLQDTLRQPPSLGAMFEPAKIDTEKLIDAIQYGEKLKELRAELNALYRQTFPSDLFPQIEFPKIDEMDLRVWQEISTLPQETYASIESRIFDFNKFFQEESQKLYDNALKQKEAWENAQLPPNYSEQYKAAAQLMEQFGDNIGQAVIYGQKLGPAVVASLKAIAAQLISKAAVYAIMSLFTGGTYNIAGMLTSGTAKSFWGYLFGGAFQEGGRPPVGVPYLVGEKGPELRIDTRPGMILPNDVFNTWGNSEKTVSELRALRFDVQRLGDAMQRLKYSISIGDKEIYASAEREAERIRRVAL